MFSRGSQRASVPCLVMRPLLVLMMSYLEAPEDRSLHVYLNKLQTPPLPAIIHIYHIICKHSLFITYFSQSLVHGRVATRVCSISCIQTTEARNSTAQTCCKTLLMKRPTFRKMKTVNLSFPPSCFP